MGIEYVQGMFRVVPDRPEGGFWGCDVFALLMDFQPLGGPDHWPGIGWTAKGCSGIVSVWP